MLRALLLHVKLGYVTVILVVELCVCVVLRWEWCLPGAGYSS